MGSFVSLANDVSQPVYSTN